MGDSNGNVRDIVYRFGLLSKTKNGSASLPANGAANSTSSNNGNTRYNRSVRINAGNGIGEKQSHATGSIEIYSVNDLAKASAEDIAKKLRISSKITKKWIGSAKALVK